jgi:hypothetical protein
VSVSTAVALLRLVGQVEDVLHHRERPTANVVDVGRHSPFID